MYLKKLALICVAFWLICLSGCCGIVEEESPYEGREVKEGIVLSMDQTVYSKDVEQMTFYLKNTTQEEFHFGYHWKLEIFYKEKWYSVPLVKSCVINDIAVISRPGTVTEVSVNSLGCYAHPLKKGSYRLVHDNYDKRDKDNTIIFIEFEVK